MSECRDPGRFSNTLYASCSTHRIDGLVVDSSQVLSSSEVCVLSLVVVIVIVTSGFHGYLSASRRTWVKG
jgi:hypothetical protein